MIQGQKAKTVLLIAPKAVTAAEEVTGSVDTAGADYAELIVAVTPTTTTSGTTVVAFADSDDNTTFVTIVANQTVTAGSSGARGLVICQVELRGKKRYLRVTATQNTTTNTTGALGAIARLSNLSQGPASTSDMIGVTVGGAAIPKVVVQV